MKLNELTIVEAIKGLKEKQFSAVELTESCLKRIETVVKKTQAFLTIAKSEAKTSAQEIDKLINKNKDIFKEKPLLGIPVAFKDLYCTRGIRTTAASKVLENYIPQYDATVVKKYKEAGAIIVGKTNCDAWAHGASGENSDYPPAKNPWNLNYVPGGSSSGSAVAVASNMCLAAGGTDTGGSIRFPAGFCNVVGLKPTYGRVSRSGIVAMSSSLDSIGHLTKDVADCALVLSVTAGKDDFDATSSNNKVPNYLESLKTLEDKNLKGLTIGLPKEYFIPGLAVETKTAVMEAIKLLTKTGCEFKEITLPHTEYAIAVYYIIQPAEVSSNLARYDGIRYGNKRISFGDEAKRRIMLGTYTLSAGYYDAYYLKAMKVRSKISQDFIEAFKRVDLILAPVSPTPPFKLGEKVNDPLSMYLCDVFMTPSSLSGIPALAIPCGFTKNNLPIGMQLMGPQFSEEKLFQIGYLYQQLTEWHKRKPDL